MNDIIVALAVLSLSLFLPLLPLLHTYQVRHQWLALSLLLVELRQLVNLLL